MAEGYRPHVMKMVKDITQNHDVQARYQQDREAVWDQYRLNDEEREAFAEPWWTTLESVGVPPVGVIGFMLYANPDIHHGMFNMEEFAERLLEADA